MWKTIKKFIILAAVIPFMISCGGGGSKSATNTEMGIYISDIYEEVEIVSIRSWNAHVTVTLVDETGVPVEGKTIIVRWDQELPGVGKTDENGEHVFIYELLQTEEVDFEIFHVDSSIGYSYTPENNIEDSVTVRRDYSPLLDGNRYNLDDFEHSVYIDSMVVNTALEERGWRMEIIIALATTTEEPIGLELVIVTWNNYEPVVGFVEDGVVVLTRHWPDTMEYVDFEVLDVESPDYPYIVEDNSVPAKIRILRP